VEGTSSARVAVPVGIIKKNVSREEFIRVRPSGGIHQSILRIPDATSDRIYVAATAAASDSRKAPRGKYEKIEYETSFTIRS
jgi:hypothetical protein